MSSGRGWHNVQNELQWVAYGTGPPKWRNTTYWRAILKPGVRVTPNHWIGAAVTELWHTGDPGRVITWLKGQLAYGLQGGEQGSWYTQFYREDVFAALRWARHNNHVELSGLCHRWLRLSLALDALHAAPGVDDVQLPCSRWKPQGGDTRRKMVDLWVGLRDPKDRPRPGERCVEYMENEMREGGFPVDTSVAPWVRRLDVPAAPTHVLDDLVLLRPIVFEVRDEGWISRIPGGAPGRLDPVDAVAYRCEERRYYLQHRDSPPPRPLTGRPLRSFGVGRRGREQHKDGTVDE